MHKSYTVTFVQLLSSIINNTQTNFTILFQIQSHSLWNLECWAIR